MTDPGKAPSSPSQADPSRKKDFHPKGPQSEAEDFQLSAYDYVLPEKNIAQEPSEKRDTSRLLVLKSKGNTESRVFHEIEALIPPGTLIVMNDTRVMPARLFGRKDSGGKIELLRVHDPSLPAARGRFLSKGARLKQPGTKLHFKDGCASLIEKSSDGTLILEIEPNLSWERVHESEGELPLPPYIERPEGPRPEDEQRYQTVFAREDGAVAAPTAGLHFTDALIERLKSKGVDFATITLHVGPGTFQPVRNEDIRKHQIRAEWAEIPKNTAESIRMAKSAGRPLIAVGTTVVRTLEGAAKRHGSADRIYSSFHAEDLVILPGHEFKVVDGMITNFHLPKSSLMLLVSALVGRTHLMNAYARALAEGYRFYSYGDAMFIPPKALEQRSAE